MAEAEDADACTLYVARVAQAGGIGLDADRAAQGEGIAEDDSITETVRIEQQATIEGEVRVTLPDPQVEIEQSPAEIAVHSRAPDVSIEQARPVIGVRQAQPVIRVQMTQPIITVEQPAPEITMTMPDLGVNVASAQPTVEVNIPEPRVTVTPGEPIAADSTDAAVGNAPTRTLTVGELDGMQVVDGDGEELGEVERVVRNGPDSYLIIEHGGWFFGLNDKEVAFPIDDVTVSDDTIVLRGMTEAQIDATPDYDAGDEIDLGTDDEIQVLRIDG